MYDYITIERSYASGGHQIAKELSQTLHYRLYDHEILVETCEQLGLPYNMLADMDEHLPVKAPFSVPGDKYLPLEEQIYQTETKIIREDAKEPGCIFIGRCASEILKDFRCLKVFITADRAFRTQRAIEVEKIDPSHADGIMRKFDNRRQKYFTAHTKAKWGTPEYFDIVLNSGELGIEACVDILAAACRH